MTEKLKETLPRWLKKITSIFTADESSGSERPDRQAFWRIVRKEFADSIRSWRIVILLGIILLTCIASLYTAVTTIQDVVEASKDAQKIGRGAYLFLSLFTVSDGTMPSFITFIGLLGPLLGIALGFDAINSERNRGTLSRLMSQPVPRDYVINAKFVSSVLLLTLLFFSLGFLVMALGILILGIPPTWEEFARIMFFLFMCIVYIAFWLNLGILFSVIFQQAATSALASLAVWLFFGVFFPIIVNLFANNVLNVEQIATMGELLARYGWVLALMRLSPNYLFNELVSVLLSPTTRYVGIVTAEQMAGAVTSPLPLSQSLLLVWPQITAMIAATLICFAVSYVLFMRQEIRA